MNRKHVDKRTTEQPSHSCTYKRDRQMKIWNLVQKYTVKNATRNTKEKPMKIN